MIRCIRVTEPGLYVWDRRFPVDRLEIKLKGNKFTLVNYYNDPYKAIPVLYQPHTYYLHHILPAYLVYFRNRQYVGTYKEIARKVRVT